MVSGPFYRTRQFIGALKPHVRNAELQEARSFLGPKLTPLFESMAPRDRRHCLDVYAKLLASECADQDTLTAALLHDSGKGHLTGVSVRLWHRVAYVLLDAAAPSFLSRVAHLSGGMSVLANHAQLGADFAESMGASAEVVMLIQNHEGPSNMNQAQVQLRTADDDS